MRAAYTGNFEHLLDELRWLDRILESAIQRFRAQRRNGEAGDFRGLYISDEEIDLLLQSSREGPSPGQSDSQEQISALRTEIDERIAATAMTTIRLRLPHMCSVFGLTRLESDLLLLTLAPEVDLRYQRLYSFLQDDVSRKHPTVDLALSLFCSTLKQRIETRNLLAESAPLVALCLLELQEDPQEHVSLLLGRYLKLDDRVVDFLLGSDRLDRRLYANLRIASCLTPQKRLEDLIISDDLAKRLRSLSRIDSRRPTICVFQGPLGTGKKLAAEAICRELGRSLIVADVSAMLTAGIPFQKVLRLALREVRLYGSLIYLDGWHEVLADERQRLAAVRSIEQEMERFPGLVILGSHSAWQPALPGNYDFVSVEFSAPDEGLRRRIWKAHLNNGNGISEGIDADYLAGAFRFTSGQITRAIAHAQRDAHLEHGLNYKLTFDDLTRGCRYESRQHLISFSKKITSQRSWSDLVVPKDTQSQLRELCQQVRYRAEVYGDWGFGQRISLGKGLIALFTGSSGTGKTLSAEILANELGLDLYKVDLSCVVSKYVGETEKNLSHVFEDAQASGAILFFDEADALFGKRSEVKDAHDRYANIEINYLLQQVEEYEGVIILATNLSKNIDAAFLRRMHFCIEFPFPDESHRAHIWRGIFPPQAPLSSDIDFEFLSRKFKIAGGNIKNVALAAAFRAAEADTAIRMEHLILALKREYQKLGKVCERAEFETYYDLVR